MTRPCAFCDPAAAKGCKACAQWAHHTLIKLHHDFESDHTHLLANVADQWATEREFTTVSFRLPYLCARAPLPLGATSCACACCRTPNDDNVGCFQHCCRRHGPMSVLRRDAAQFAAGVAAGAELDQEELDRQVGEGGRAHARAWERSEPRGGVEEWGSDSDSEWDVLDGSENAFLSEFWAARGGGVGI